jgi:hypothetical protein
VHTRMKAVAKQASALAKQLRSFQAAMDELIPLHRSGIVKRMELPLRAEWAGLKLERIPSFLAQKFDNVSNRAVIYAPMFVDKGGKPLMVEFRALAQGLRHAFERATGRPATVTVDPVTVDPDCKYVGDFLKLLETMLPLTRDCARQFGWELSYPQTTSARGKYVEKLTTAGKSLAPGSWLISDAGA